MIEPQDLVEQLAAIEHERWSQWMRWQFSLCNTLDTGEVVIPSELVERWTRQMNTRYRDLTEQEKDSDREEARKSLGAVSDFLKRIAAQ